MIIGILKLMGVVSGSWRRIYIAYFPLGSWLLVVGRS